jgi:hypothetical protein
VVVIWVLLNRYHLLIFEMKGYSLLRLNIAIILEIYHEIVKDLGMMSWLCIKESEGDILSKPMGSDRCNDLYSNLPTGLRPKTS